MEPIEVLKAIRSRWWMLIVGVLVGLLAAVGLTEIMTPQYSSTSRLFVSAASADPTAAYDASLLSEGRIASYSEILTSDTLATRVVDELSLPMSPAELAKKISVTTVPSTVILDVTVTDSSPTRARDIADTLDSAFVSQVAALEGAPGGAAAPIKVSVLQAPQVNTIPISPNRSLIVGIGLALGLLVGLLGALARHRFDHRITSGEEVAQTAGVELLGAVRRDPRLRAGHAVTIADERSVSAEAFRRIRTNLQYLEGEQRPGTIVVSSPSAGEGTTTIALNLAAALGGSGSRVLLVEGDLRRPSLARKLDLAPGGGLADVLMGHVDPSRVIQPWGDGGVGVLAAGSTPPRPSDLLGSPSMRTLLKQLRNDYDFVVIDAPPLLQASDATVLSVMAGACLLTLRYGKTTREELAGAAAMLRRLHVRLVGAVLNDVPRRAARGAGVGFASAASPAAPTETSPNFVFPPRPPVPHPQPAVAPASISNGGRSMS